MPVRYSYHPPRASQVPDHRLRLYADQLLVLAAEALRTRTPTTTLLSDATRMAAIPTVLTASRDERHEATLRAAGSLGRYADGASISHTREISVVFRPPRDSEWFGIDLERTTPERPRLARRIRSRLEVETLPIEAPWGEVLRCFCAKEAAFKALDREAQVGLTFRRLAVDRPRPGASAWVRRVSDGHIVAEACVVTNADLVVAIARAVRPSTG
jgi:hypothetical protein